MKLSEIVRILGADVILNARGSDPGVELVCGSDLMSDVLAFSRPDALLLTGLATAQVIYTAEMADIRIICFVRDKRLPADAMSLAAEKNIILLQTRMPMFESCGRLHAAGLRGCYEP